MKVVPFVDLARERWDEACDASPHAWLYHRAAWIEIEASSFALENHSFALLDGERVVGLQPLFLSELGLGTFTERLLHSGIHRHTGLAIPQEMARPERNAARRVAMQRVNEVAAARDVDRVQLNSQNLAPGNRGPSREEIPFWVTSHGFQLGLNFAANGMLPAPGMTTCCADQIVELGRPLAELFERLDEACRRAVRKADASELALEAGAGPECIARYYRLARLSAQRTGESLPPVDYYSRVWSEFASAGRCAVLFAHRQRGDAGALFLCFDKHAASFFAGVSDPEALSLRVNDFLHWRAIGWLKERGMECYRLGPAFPELLEDWPIVRVSRFKTKFGGRSVPVIQGSLFRKPEKYLAHGIAHLQAACARPVA
jgi:Acetyltransferase (GNAT) domain